MTRVTEYEKPDNPRGIRNHNPGNIEGDGTEWRGLKSLGEMTELQRSETRFMVFRAPEFGIRAMTINLQSYRIRHNRTSVQRIIERWAPSRENDVAAYVANVATRMEVDPNEDLDTSDPMVLKPLIEAIIWHENGVQPYPAETIMKGIGMALGGAADPVPHRSATKAQIDSLGRTAGKVAGGVGLAVLLGLIGQDEANVLTASAETLLTEENIEAAGAILAILAGLWGTFRSLVAPERKQ